MRTYTNLLKLKLISNSMWLKSTPISFVSYLLFTRNRSYAIGMIICLRNKNVAVMKCK